MRLFLVILLSMVFIGCSQLPSKCQIIDQIIARMRSDDFTERERATDELYALLEGSEDDRTMLIECIQRCFQETDDDEVRYRLDPIVHPWAHFEKLFVLEHQDTVSDIAFSPKGEFLASIAGDKLYIWDYKRGKRIYLLKWRKTGLWDAVKFSPDATKLVTAGHGTLCIWDSKTGKRLRKIGVRDIGVAEFALSPNSKLLAIAYSFFLDHQVEHRISLWDIDSGKRICIFKGHTDRISSITFSPDGSLLSSGGDDNTVRVWDICGRKCIHVLKGHSDCVNALAFSPDGELLASGSDDKSIRIWHPREGKCVHLLMGHTNKVSFLEFSPNGRMLASAAWDKTIRLWNPFSGKLLHTLIGHKGSINSITFDPYGRMLVSADFDGALRMWETRSGKCVRTIHSDYPYSGVAEFDVSGRFLAFNQGGGTIVIWSIPKKDSENGPKGKRRPEQESPKQPPK